MRADLSLEGSLFQEVFDASPSLLFVVDHDVRILHLNKAAVMLFGGSAADMLSQRGGEALHCLHASEHPDGCGRAMACRGCPVRDSVDQAMAGCQVFRRQARMELVVNGQPERRTFLVTAAPFHHGDRPLVLLGLEDISELLTLRGLLPICASCKKVRNDHGYWEEIERYLRRHIDVDFTHGICPDCARRLYPKLTAPEGEES